MQKKERAEEERARGLGIPNFFELHRKNAERARANKQREQQEDDCICIEDEEQTGAAERKRARKQ